MSTSRVEGSDPRAPRSLWLREAMGKGFVAEPHLQGETKADVCIVGGGYTGLWTALRLKEVEPTLEVVVLEADVCGGGASGRNGGFILSWWAKFLSLVKQCGVEEALRLADASADAVAEIGAFCSANGLEAAFHQRGWVWAASNPSQVGAWTPTMRELDRLGVHPFEELDQKEAAACTGSAVHGSGVFERTAAVVQPALLAFGLRRIALARGMRIHEGSPMTNLRPGAGRVRVETPAGAVTAGRAVLALNAWAVRFAEIRRRILVVGSDVAVTPSIGGALADMGWSDGPSVSDSRLLVHYYRTTDDGRVVFGKGGGILGAGSRVGPRFEGASLRLAELESALRTTYPALAGVPIVQTWTGPIDRSRSGLPLFGSLAHHGSVFYGVGFSGNGVGPSLLAGRILASLALGRDDEWARCGLVSTPGKRFPPEPVRYVGGRTVRGAIARKERMEDRGRRAGPVTRGLAALAPAGLVPNKGG